MSLRPAFILLGLSLLSSIRAEWSPHDLAQFWVSPGKPANLEWRWNGDHRPESAGFSLRDYAGNLETTGTLLLSDENLARVKLMLHPGWHELTLEPLGTRFGVMAQESAPGPADPFFCIDGSFSWLAAQDVREDFIRILKRVGIAMVRERYDWKGTNPAPDQFDFEFGLMYDTLRRQYQQYDLPILEMFHNAPPYVGGSPSRPLPQDMLATYRAWRTITERWHAGWGGLEVWNEPDLQGTCSPEQYMSLFHTLNYASRDREFALGGPVVSGGFPAHFFAMCRDNGLLAATDYVSFHTYQRAGDIEHLVAEYRRWLSENQCAGMPLWLTESGRSWTPGNDRAPRAEDLDSALDITMKAVESRACGVTRYFAFVFPFYEEPSRSYGLNGREGTPLRSIAAYAACARMLGGLDYLGDLTVDDPAVRRARIFGNEPRTIAVVYTGVASPDATVRLGSRHQGVYGADGRILVSASDSASAGVIPVPDGMVYVALDRQELVDRLQPDTAAVELWRAGRTALPPRKPVSPIVLQVFPAEDQVLVQGPDGMIARTRNDEVFQVTVRMNNLSTATLVTLLDTEDGSTTAPRNLGTFNLPPRAWVETESSFQTEDWKNSADFRTLLWRARPQGESDHAVQAALRVMFEVPLELLLTQASRPTLLPIDALDRWEPFISAGGRMQMSCPATGTWRLDVEFDATPDPWVFPRFKVEKGTLTNAAALIYEARCERPAVVRLMLNESDGSTYMTLTPPIAQDGQWHATRTALDSLTMLTLSTDENGRLDPDQIDQVVFGINAREPVNALEVRNVYLVEK